MADNELKIEVAATGGDAAAGEVKKVTEAVKAQTAALSQVNAQSAQTVTTSTQRIAAAKAEEMALRTQIAQLKQLEIAQREAAAAAAAAAEGDGGAPVGGMDGGGKIGAGIATAITAVIGLAKATAEADAAFRALEHAGEQAGQNIDSAMRVNAVQGMEAAFRAASDLQEKLWQIDNKSWFQKLRNEIGEGFGISGDTQIKGALEREAEARREQGHQAAALNLADQKRVSEIERLKADGRTKEASDKQRQLDFDLKDREIKERFRKRDGDTDGQAALKEMEYGQARVELEKQFAAQKEAAETKRAAAARKEIADAEALAEARGERGEGDMDEAKRTAAQRTADRKIDDALKRKIAGELSEKEAAKIMEAAEKERDGRIEEVDRKARERAQKARNEDREAMDEAIAHKEKFDADQQAQADRAAKKAEEAAERLAAKVQAAADKRLVEAQEDFNKAVDADVAERAKPWQQKSAEAGAQKKADSAKRGVISKMVGDLPEGEKEAKRQELFEDAGLDENGRTPKPGTVQDAARELARAKKNQRKKAALERPAKKEPVADLAKAAPKGGPNGEDFGQPVDTQPVAGAAQQGMQELVQKVASALTGGLGTLNVGPIVSVIASLKAEVKAMQAQIDAIASVSGGK